MAPAFLSPRATLADFGVEKVVQQLKWGKRYCLAAEASVTSNIKTAYTLNIGLDHTDY